MKKGSILSFSVVALFIAMAAMFLVSCNNSSNNNVDNKKGTAKSLSRANGGGIEDVDSLEADIRAANRETSQQGSGPKTVKIGSKEFKDSKKKAILIGVGNYEYPESEGGWAKINSCNDIDLLTGKLNKAGFAVTPVIDAAASLSGIKDSLDKVLKNCHTGDQVLIHFSGHGQQILSENSLNEEDEMTEAFAAYNAKKFYTKNYHGEGHFTDDMLNDYVNKFSAKLGDTGFLMVTVDACHSETATRGGNGAALTRGESHPLLWPDYTPKRSKVKGKRYIELSACQDNKLNYEYYDETSKKTYGSLSFLLGMALDKGLTDFVAITDYVMKYYKETMKRGGQKPCAGPEEYWGKRWSS